MMRIIVLTVETLVLTLCAINILGAVEIKAMNVLIVECNMKVTLYLIICGDTIV